MADCGPLTPGELQNRLSQAARRQVLLMLTDNTSQMLSLTPAGPGVVELRAHHMFLDAPEEVLLALESWVAGRRLPNDPVRSYIDANGHRIRRRDRESRPAAMRTKGRHHNLGELHSRLNSTYLDGRSTARVTWGRKPGRRRVRTVRLGTYDPVGNLITISRRLDASDVPRYMVEYVLFHEMLHEVLGIGERPDGRRDIHGRTFRLMEQSFPWYERALAFERKKWG